MPDTPTPTVPEAFAALVSALQAEAMRADFDRAAAFRRAVMTLAERWDAGAPPHTVRTPAKKPTAVEPELADPEPEDRDYPTATVR